MENCLQKNPDIDVVYTINEPSAAGAWTALKNAGKSKSDVTIVSVDGGCAGVRNVKAGVIDATSQQYPLLMASHGVAAVVNYAKTGKKVVRLHGHRRQPDRRARRSRASRPRASPTASPTAGARQIAGHSRDRGVPSCAPVAAARAAVGSRRAGYAMTTTDITPTDDRAAASAR